MTAHDCTAEKGLCRRCGFGTCGTCGGLDYLSNDPNRPGVGICEGCWAVKTGKDPRDFRAVISLAEKPKE